MKLEKFDYQIGNKRKKRTFIILGLVCLGAFITVILYKTFASYKGYDTHHIIGGKIANFGIEGVNMYIVLEDGTETPISIVPKNDVYVYDASRSSCQNGTEIVYNKEDKTLSVDESAGDTCNVYFNYIPLSTQTLYALGYTLEDVKEGIPYGPNGTNESGFYAAEDDYGTSYYYYTASGDYSTPYISGYRVGLFLLRINGNGSVRTVYDYHNYHSSFNDVEVQNNNSLGYVYNDSVVENIDNFKSSSLKTHIDAVNSSGLRNYIDDVIFCNDRSLYDPTLHGTKENDDLATGVGTDVTYYAGYYRIRNNTPSLKCAQKDDAFTVNDTDNGNGLLDIPYGLLSIDEVYMTNFQVFADEWAGMASLTMTPAMFKDGVAYIYQYQYGGIATASVKDSLPYMAVLNIKYGTEFSGSDGWFDIVE